MQELLSLFAKHIIKFTQKYNPRPNMNQKIIIALGNPGKKYETTRHNLGWMALDAYKTAIGTDDIKWENHNRTKALIAKIPTDTILLLVKPVTFMNNSGDTVQDIISFYKATPSDIIVIHDDKDLAFGSMRITQDASSGGHNGVQSIITKIGTQKFTRLRLGIKSNKASKIPAEKFVLQPFTYFEKRNLKKWLLTMVEAIECLVDEDVAQCMTRFNH